MQKKKLVYDIGLMSILTALVSFASMIVIEFKTFANLESKDFFELFSKTSTASHFLVILCALTLTVSILAYLYLYSKAPRKTIV